MTKPNGVIIYQGPSKLDGQPIVVVAVGLKNNSTNTKTGAMVQTYILRADVNPMEAVKTGADASICGACPHRGDGTGKGRSCYVTLVHGPRGVFKAFENGSYPVMAPRDAAELCKDRMVRLGTYGDPAAVPIYVWRALLAQSKGHTGYTHQWKTTAPQWSALVMASADTPDEMTAAQAKGYRTFRVSPVGGQAMAGLEILCPASEEAGRKTTCEQCRACMGTAGKAKVSIYIPAHGIGKKHVALPLAA